MRGDRAVVLLGEHLGGREQRRLAARVDDREHRAQRDHRLARADLALQQPVHRVLARPGRRRSPAPTSCWPAVRVNGSRASNAVEQAAAPAAGAASAGSGGRRRPALGEHRLQDERLVAAQPAAGRGVRRRRCRAGGSSRSASRGRAGRDAARSSGGSGSGRLARSGSTTSRATRDRLAHPPGRQLGGGRVDREQAAGEVLARRRRRPTSGLVSCSLPRNTSTLPAKKTSGRPASSFSRQAWLKNVSVSPPRPSVTTTSSLCRLGAHRPAADRRDPRPAR